MSVMLYSISVPGLEPFSLDSFFFAAAVGIAIKSRMMASVAIMEAVRAFLDTDTIDQTPILNIYISSANC